MRRIKLMVRLQTQEQHDALQEAADEAGEPLATWARRILLAAADGPPEDEESAAIGRGLREGDGDAAVQWRRRSDSPYDDP